MERTENELKQEYEILKQKYNLPEFEHLAEDFDIEKVSEKESSFLLREIRRIIAEKLSAYTHLLETFLNPTAPPMFIFTILKNSNEGEKEIIKKIYKELAKLQINEIKLDIIYSEKEEAEFIIKSSKQWDQIKKESYDLVEQFEKRIEENNNFKNKGYFG